MNNEDMLDKLSNQIDQLHKELIKKDIDSFNDSYRDELYNLQEHLLLMHRRIKDLSQENSQLKEDNRLLKLEYDSALHLKEQLISRDAEIKKLSDDYHMVINSRSWKLTQVFRNIYWNLKGKNENI